MYLFPIVSDSCFKPYSAMIKGIFCSLLATITSPRGPAVRKETAFSFSLPWSCISFLSYSGNKPFETRTVFLFCGVFLLLFVSYCLWHLSSRLGLQHQAKYQSLVLQKLYMMSRLLSTPCIRKISKGKTRTFLREKNKPRFQNHILCFINLKLSHTA